MEETKKKMSKKKKIVLITSLSLVGVILLGLIITVIVLFSGGGGPTHLDNSKLQVHMFDDYYIGDDNTLDLATVFKDANDFAYSGEGMTIAGSVATVTAADKKGTLTFTQDGKKVTKNIFTVDGKNVLTEDDMRTTLNSGVSIVLHSSFATTGADGFKLVNNAKVYGNGNTINSDTVTKKRGKSEYGKDLFWADANVGVNIQDLHVIGNTVADGAEANVEDFEYSGNLVNISGEATNGAYAKSVLKNCIFENGQKLLHVQGADLVIDGCIFRNGADANIAIATSEKKGSNIVIRNSVSMNSVVAGMLFYNMTPTNDASQHVVDIQGFFDIYNWKSTSTTKLVPSTEGPVAKLVNGRVQAEVKSDKFAKYLYTDPKTNEQYVHIGIIKLSTNKSGLQNPTIMYNGEEGKLPPQYKELDFPIPSWALNISFLPFNSCTMIAYEDGVKDPYIAPNAQLTESIFEEMRNGRKAA